MALLSTHSRKWGWIWPQLSYLRGPRSVLSSVLSLRLWQASPSVDDELRREESVSDWLLENNLSLIPVVIAEYSDTAWSVHISELFSSTPNTANIKQKCVSMLLLVIIYVWTWVTLITDVLYVKHLKKFRAEGCLIAVVYLVIEAVLFFKNGTIHLQGRCLIGEVPINFVSRNYSALQRENSKLSQIVSNLEIAHHLQRILKKNKKMLYY